MSSIKESLAQSLGSGAGELAQNLFDRFKKNRADSSSKLITSFANNAEQKISSSTRPSISLSKLLTEQDKNPETEQEKDVFFAEHKLEKSKSEVYITPKKSLVQSVSLNTPLSKIEPEPNAIVEPSAVVEDAGPIEPPDQQTDSIENNLASDSSAVWNQNFLVPSVILAFSILVIIFKYISWSLLNFILGLVSGVGACVTLFWIMLKFDLAKYLHGFKEEKKSECGEQNVKNFLIQSAVRKENRNFDGVYKGWMNELRESYSPESYFINKTRSVFLNLDGSLLRLQISSNRVPKRAIVDEKIGQVQLNDLRIFELGDSQVSLLPSQLCRKRYWSKKYPICIKKCRLLNKKTDSETETELILFARTDREKEEWFSLFKKSSSKQLLSSEHYRSSRMVEVPKRLVSQNSLNLKYDVINDKIVYRLEDSEKKETSDLNAETQTDSSYMYDSSLAFMNTFLIRVFADFFYDKYWIGQVQTKIQNKLNKIRMPHFMESLLVTGVDLGSVVPLIKQVSEPWYDDKGLWVHLDIDYNGSIQMSLATKLNLMKLRSDDSDAKRESRPNRQHNPAIEQSSEEDSPESSGDEYVHSDEENKLVET
ncbi:testis-expressed sequence 2 isoform X1 [Brachionus plicatilis]|uniref:Testis-expressed sequence 2 isoform X1 n=1 Tax=Brachionus plicatilis TaxID=10195 RepID=A0A3M7P5H5_BRAPC|nr:testis-expressed sequence 2 isoform X1 [Brachionus plicatilis]